MPMGMVGVRGQGSRVGGRQAVGVFMMFDKYYLNSNGFAGNREKTKDAFKAKKRPPNLMLPQSPCQSWVALSIP